MIFHCLKNIIYYKYQSDSCKNRKALNEYWVGEEMKRKSILMAMITIIVVIAIIVTVIVMMNYNSKSAETEEKNRTESEAKTGVNIEFTYFEEYWQNCDLTNAVYKTQAEYETAVRNYINQIALLLNKSDWYKQYKNMDTLYIALDISDTGDEINQGGISISQNNSKTSYTCDLHLSNTMFKHNKSQLVRVLTELVIMKSEKYVGFINSLEDGFCQYVQSNLGMGIGSLNYGLDIHNYLREFTKQNIQNADNNNNMNKIRDDAGNLSRNIIYRYVSPKSHFNHDYWILCNYSFVDYLVNTYGLESVMKMVDGYDDSIYYLFNQDGLSGLVSDWKHFLEMYPCKMTWDEIDAKITELKSTRGY